MGLVGCMDAFTGVVDETYDWIIVKYIDGVVVICGPYVHYKCRIYMDLELVRASLSPGAFRKNYSP